jgi:hypothetical protein
MSLVLCAKNTSLQIPFSKKTYKKSHLSYVHVITNISEHVAVLRVFTANRRHRLEGTYLLLEERSGIGGDFDSKC